MTFTPYVDVWCCFLSSAEEVPVWVGGDEDADGGPCQGIRKTIERTPGAPGKDTVELLLDVHWNPGTVLNFSGGTVFGNDILRSCSCQLPSQINTLKPVGSWIYSR